MKYSDERREAILKKLLPPHNRTVAEVAQEEGISAATLYNSSPGPRKGVPVIKNCSAGDAGKISASSSRIQDHVHLDVLFLVSLKHIGDRCQGICRLRVVYPGIFMRAS